MQSERDAHIASIVRSASGDAHKNNSMSDALDAAQHRHAKRPSAPASSRYDE
jgi:hypothetical protein